MPLLARMLPAPLGVLVRPGAIADLGTLLLDLQIARSGRIAVVVGSAQGDSIAAELNLADATIFRASDANHATAVGLGQQLRADRFEAVAGIGGGRTIDVTKFAAHMAGIPMVAVTTSLAHDGIASPVSTLRHESGTDSYGVVMPAAVIVDLDRVRQAPRGLSIAGIGDAISDISAVDDWELAAADTGEPFDGLSAAMARTAGQAVLRHPGDTTSDTFLTVLAESLILSGFAMAVAGSSRPASGGDHEIMHAVNQLYPGTASHGELAGVGALFCAHLRKDAGQFDDVASCLLRHGLPRTPEDLGLTDEQFARAVALAPATRPGRYTILERLALTDDEIIKQVDSYVGVLSAG